MGKVRTTLDLATAPVDGQELLADSTRTGGRKWGHRSRVAAEAHVDAGPLNSVAATALFTLALPTSLAAGDLVRIVAAGDQLNNSAGAVTYTFIFSIGATAVLTTNALSFAQTANRRRWRFEADLTVVTTASQRVGGQLLVSATAATVTMPGANSAVMAAVGYGTATEDLTAGKNAILTATLGTADANADCICHFADLTVIKK